jgi:deoxycytidine triphosphate deaminase
MGLLSDIEIRECVEFGDMISPFEPGQVRVVDGENIVSYGTSSYGYDIRCSDEFKVFTDIHSTIIDPKKFDENSFVDVKGPYCIIPPNSFALSNSIEYFKMPKDILAVVVGKSTYARCFTGDTRVQLTCGRTFSFIDLIEKSTDPTFDMTGFSLNKDNEDCIVKLTAPRKTGTKEIGELILSDGQVIKCTPDHKFMLLCGEWVEAQYLIANDELHPLFRKNTREYVGGVPLVVEEFKRTGEIEDVYCLTAPEYGNFALAAGVYVKNCGLIVNVTPIEPEWEGVVTLEFSNTTRLPIKVYANEGVAQFLFFRGDSIPSMSYGRRNGKYQRQTGITLPKV